MELKRIDVAGIRPNENNPRADFGDLDALWESFALNTANPGEPVNPIVVVADGPVYRIVDGERRYRAMSDHGQESCMAVVCDGYDDMAQAVQMLATDDKLSLTPEEAGQGIQQMLLLGVDVERVAAASKAPAESVRAVRRVLRCRQGEGVFQATLDQMLAVADVDENGDGDLADEMLSDRNWRQSYDKFKREQARQAQVRDLGEGARAAGFELLPEGFDQADYGPSRAVYDAGEFAGFFEKGYRFASVWVGRYGVECRAYLPKGGEPGKSEAELAAERESAEREARRGDVQAALESLRTEVACWYAANMSAGSPTQAQTAIDNMARRALFDPDEGWLSDQVGEFEDITGARKPFSAPPQLTWELRACAFPLLYPGEPGYSLTRAVALGVGELEDWGARHAVESAHGLLARVNAFVAAGWLPTPEADALLREVERVAAWKPEGVYLVA